MPRPARTRCRRGREEPPHLRDVLAAGLPAWVASFTLARFGITLLSALTDPQWLDPGLVLEVVEIFAGVAAVTAAASSRGFAATAIDIVFERKKHNLLERSGFLLALACVLALPPGGLLILAPVCSSFVFPNSSRTKRKRTNFVGDVTYRPVRDGNSLAETAIFLFAVAAARGCYAGLENPAGSAIFSYLEFWIDAIPGLEYFIMHRCAYAAEALGKRFLKPFKWMACGPVELGGGAWLAPAVRRCPCEGAAHRPLMSENARGRTSGTPALLESQAYPPKMAKSILRAWETAKAETGDLSDSSEEEDSSHEDSSYEDSSSSESASSDSVVQGKPGSRNFTPRDWAAASESPANHRSSGKMFQPGSWAR